MSGKVDNEWTRSLFRIRMPKTGYEVYGVSTRTEILFRDYSRSLEIGSHSNRKLQKEYDENMGVMEMDIIKTFPKDTTLKELHGFKKKFLDKLKEVNEGED